MSVKISVVANCQAGAIASVLRLSCSEVEICSIPAVHTIPKDAADKVLDTAQNSDVIIHQPIGEAFGPISADALKAALPNKTFISFPSIYFGGLLPHLSYLRKPGGGTLKGPLGDYHDMRILRSYLSHQSMAQCLAGIEHMELDAKAHYASCMEESRKREADVDIPVMDLVEERIRDEQVFYTFNHVDNALLWSVASQALSLLGLSPDLMQRPPQKLLLGSVIAAVPASVTTALGCTWSRHDYLVKGTELPTADLVEQMYQAYDGVQEFTQLISFNKKRFALPVALV